MAIINTNTSSPASADPQLIAYSAPVTAGNTLIGVIRTGSATTVTVSDSVNGAWTAGPSHPTDNGAGRQYMFYFMNTAAGTPTVTFDLSAAGAPRLFIGEIEYADASSFDVGATNSGTGTALTSGATVATAKATETAIGAFSVAADHTFVQNGSWVISEVEPAAGSSRLAVVYQDLTSVDTPNAAIDVGGSVAWIGQIITFQTTPPVVGGTGTLMLQFLGI
jgi:hypothetical protein